MEWLPSVDQLCYKNGGDGKVKLLVASAVDDFSISSVQYEIDKFLRVLRSKFKLGSMGS